jgi:predicted nuclease of restriction endonuclease-like RecB superfamily
MRKPAHAAEEEAMLTKELAIADFESGGRLVPDRLNRALHAGYLAHSARMLEVYRKGVGRTRQELRCSVHAIFANQSDCPIRRVDAFCKLLDDVSTFSRGRPEEAAALRREVFGKGAVMHPLVASADRLHRHGEKDAKALIASGLGMSWSDVDSQLFADIPECHRLESFDGYASPEALLARYNVAQIQVALFRATAMTIWATNDFKTIVRYAKLARLLHSIRRLGASQYVIRLDGPASVLRGTRRYGVAMAKFLPALIACRGWRMHAVLQTQRRGWLASLDLSADDGLHSHLPPPAEFDSGVEEMFARKWGATREGWTLHRETEMLHRDQKVFVPDFLLRHESGQEALLEIVGFWTPEYLQAKWQTLRMFQDRRILLALGGPAAQQMADLGLPAVHFKKHLRPDKVLELLRAQTQVQSGR